MGKGIVYCELCGERILEEQFQKGDAVTFADKNYCKNCKQRAIEQLGVAQLLLPTGDRPAPPHGPPTPRPPRSHGPVTPAHPTPHHPKQSTNRRTLRAMKSQTIAGIAVAIVLVAGILLLVASGGSPPSEPQPPPPLKASAVGDAAKQAIERLRRLDAESANPQAIVDAALESKAALAKTPYEFEAGEIEQRARAKIQNALERAEQERRRAQAAADAVTKIQRMLDDDADPKAVLAECDRVRSEIAGTPSQADFERAEGLARTRAEKAKTKESADTFPAVEAPAIGTWTSVFDGKSMDRWFAFKQKDEQGGWRVDAGVLAGENLKPADKQAAHLLILKYPSLTDVEFEFRVKVEGEGAVVGGRAAIVNKSMIGVFARIGATDWADVRFKIAGADASIQIGGAAPRPVRIDKADPDSGRIVLSMLGGTRVWIKDMRLLRKK